MTASTVFGLAVAGATAGTIAVEGLATLVLLPAASTVVMTLGAVQPMKVVNRNAQRRRTTGEFPDMKAQRPGMPRSDDQWRERLSRDTLRHTLGRNRTIT